MGMTVPQQHMYSMNTMPFNGLKTLQTMLKSNSYYGSMEDEGYGYMPVGGHQGMIGDFGFFGYEDSLGATDDFDKKPDISSMSDPNGAAYQSYNSGAAYVKEIPKKEFKLDCLVKCDHKHTSDEPKFAHYYRSKKDYR